MSVVAVTAGPGSEPIDEVRCLTNHSTGQLGVMLANRLAEQGWDVICLLGKGAIVRGPLHERARRVAFDTNADLLRQLEALAAEQPVAAVFQAAALCDFRVREIRGAGGSAAKISSRAGEIELVLEPAPKVLGHLRGLFPGSALVGWKYELAGTRAETIEKGCRQMAENGTDLCILNGRAYGPDFGVLAPEGLLASLSGKAELCAWLAEWLGRRMPSP